MHNKVFDRHRTLPRQCETAAQRLIHAPFTSQCENARTCFLIDETAVKTNLTWLSDWSSSGERLKIDASSGSLGIQTLIVGQAVDALIAPWVIKGAMDGPAFAACMQQVLIPRIGP